MARGIDPAEEKFRLPGCYAALIAQQRAAAVSIDLRLLDWDLSDPGEVAADRAALVAETKAHPQESALLVKLLAGEPVVVSWSALHVPADAPGWLSDPRITHYVRIRADDLVEPADHAPDQSAQMMA